VVEAVAEEEVVAAEVAAAFARQIPFALPRATRSIPPL
jgi:hypothetical protein